MSFFFLEGKSHIRGNNIPYRARTRYCQKWKVSGVSSYPRKAFREIGSSVSGWPRFVSLDAGITGRVTGILYLSRTLEKSVSFIRLTCVIDHPSRSFFVLILFFVHNGEIPVKICKSNIYYNIWSYTLY